MKILLAAKTKIENYAEAVRQCGCIPITEFVPEEMASYAGLILCGGSDINPAYYGEKITGAANIDYQRDEAEFEMARKFVQAGKPIMGICRGYQLLNIVFGGTLYQHIDTADRHRSGTTEDLVHSVTAKEGSIAAKLYGESFTVNSYHHQAVRKLGAGLHITMQSEEDIIEGFEHDSLPIFGVQWHPERMCCSHKREDTVDGIEIFKYFIELCR